MMKSGLNCSVFLLVLSLTFCVSFGALSSIFDVSPTSEDFITCLESNSNNATTISKLIFTPVNSSYLPVWQAAADPIRFDNPCTRKPSVIVTPTTETQIQAALFCAKKQGYEMRIRDGGHDFEGLSYTANVPFVMLDLVNMRAIDVNVANRTAWVQGGAVLGELYYTISQLTDTLYFPAGIWAGVGVSGFLSGGGYGNLLRKYGLGADNVLDVRFMDVNGNILDRKSMGEDLFWAIRGGGASSFGIVLSWKLRLVPVPERVTLFTVNITLEQGATDIFHKYQYVLPKFDRDLLIRVQINSENIGNTTKKTVRLLFDGLYQGNIDTLLPLLNQSFPELNVTREVCKEVRMVQTTLQFGGFTTSTPPEVLANRSAIPKLSYKGKSDYVRTPIPKSGLRKIWRKILQNDKSETLFMYTFGGKMEEYSETAIPYPHRAGVLYQVFRRVDFIDQPSDKTAISRRRLAWIRSFDKTLEPYVSKNPREAYSNYNDLDLGVGSATYEEASVWGERYWKRENFKKLIRIKAKVDPKNFFRHPQSIPVFSTPFSDM
ncbi:putative tetrahydroberberine oxidase [Helianthus annuus]|uniref:Putative berberine/berberine-like, FAD-binding, type 2 n=1 Tax=Helianthus annuus TaxID=4232 RepID=A0A251UHJ4_HELAN|nr:berberine bridge enzyme-like 8 [Helianthus annuus]KAF5802085.1 putative tetrahydroberberine oxidase [Helianthus annuus]KAJ0573294.1 putative tetrahydroberberine oxidase [Helianthus annuus]KAJ0911589.1 putative tetrahydroberberine oxidase [Helianthus annuus]KAJ0915155.1 putative tetrahydroberberine oxidase [Helianthus annuus]